MTTSKNMHIRDLVSQCGVSAIVIGDASRATMRTTSEEYFTNFMGIALRIEIE